MESNYYELRVTYSDVVREYDNARSLKMRMVSQGPIDEDIDLRVEEEITGS